MTGEIPFVSSKIDIEAYRLLPAANWSLLRMVAQLSPAHAREKQLRQGERTKAMDFGDMVHAAILEPERLGREYLPIEHWFETTDAGRAAWAEFVQARNSAKHTKAGDTSSVDRNTREGKAAWAAFAADSGGRKPISLEEYGRLCDMVAACKAHKTASSLLYGTGLSEMTGAWIHDGVACKVRTDRMVVWRGEHIDVELKTIHSTALRAIENSGRAYAYHGQAAMRLEAWRAISKAKGGGEYPQRVIHVFVESAPPHAVRVFEVDRESLGEGREMFERAAKIWGACVASNEWPGYEDRGAPEPLNLRRRSFDAVGGYAAEEFEAFDCGEEMSE